MLITLENENAVIRYEWSDDLDTCAVLVIGDVSESELIRIESESGHEGAEVEGWETTIK